VSNQNIEYWTAECLQGRHRCSGTVTFGGETWPCECECHGPRPRQSQQRQQPKLLPSASVTSVERTWRLAEAGTPSNYLPSSTPKVSPDDGNPDEVMLANQSATEVKPAVEWETSPSKLVRFRPEYFDYYDDWEQKEIQCPNCLWRGCIGDGVIDLHNGFLDSTCPRCPVMFAVVRYATTDEIRKYGDEADRAGLAIRESRSEIIRKEGLNSPEQLPDIDEPEFRLEWDFETESEPHDEVYTVIRHNGKPIFKELAFWEGYTRFVKVAEVLCLKYGTRLTDLVPTDRSVLYLYGDDYHIGSLYVADVRKAMQTPLASKRVS
jgi:hypothetical protein